MDNNKVYDAYLMAKEKHRGQKRRDGRPYIAHPITVARVVRKYFSNEERLNEMIIAAYLHDTIEDTDTTYEEIKEKFGSYVAYLVMGVTNDEEVKKSMGKTNYLCYKMYHMNNDVLNLKLCDRLSNVMDLRNAEKSFIERYETETIMILDYLLSNRNLTETQLEIVKEINNQINDLRKDTVLALVKHTKYNQG